MTENGWNAGISLPATTDLSEGTSYFGRALIRSCHQSTYLDQA